MRAAVLASAVKPMRTVSLAIASLLLAATGCPPRGTQPQPPGDGDETATPSDPVEHAAKLMQQGKHAEAEKVIDDALAKDGKNHELLYAKGVVRREQGDVDAALKAWEAALAVKPDFFAPLVAVGAVHLDRGEFDPAIAKFQAALQINPDFPDAHYNLGLALLGAGKRAEATQAIENAHRLAADDVDVLVQLSQLYATSGREKEAVALAERAVQLNGMSSLAQLALGDARLRAGDAAGAEEAYRSAMRFTSHRPGSNVDVASIDSTATKEELTRTGLDAQLGLARALARQGKLDEAARELEDLLTKAPKSGMVLAELGGVLAKQGKLDAALANLDEAISLSPRTPSIHVKRIAALADAKKCKQAKSAYGALLELKPPDDAAQAAKQALGRCK